MVRRLRRPQSTRRPPWRLALWTSVRLVATRHSPESRDARLATLVVTLSADLKRGASLRLRKASSKAQPRLALPARLIFLRRLAPAQASDHGRVRRIRLSDFGFDLLSLGLCAGCSK